MLVSQLTGVALGWVLVVVLARSLGPGDFGLFSALYALSQSLAMVVDFGLVTYLLREFAGLKLAESPTSEERATAGHMLGRALALVGVLSAALVTLALIVTTAIGWSSDLLAGLTGLMGYTFVLAAASVIESAFRAARRFRELVSAMLIEKFLLLVALSLALLLGAGVATLAACYLGAGCLRLAIDRVWLRRRIRLSLGRPAPSGVLRLGRAATPFALNRASLALITRVDVAVVALFSTVDAAYYAVGDRTNTMLVVAAATLSSTLYPFFAGSSAKRLTRSLRVGAVMACAGLALAIAGIAFSPQILAFALGDGYRDGARTLQIMLAAVPFLFGANAVLSGLYSARFERRVAWVTCGTSLLGTIAVVLGEARLGSEGAAAGYLARQVTLAALLVHAAVSARRSGQVSIGPEPVLGD